MCLQSWCVPCAHTTGRDKQSVGTQERAGKQQLGVMHASQHDTLLWLVTGRMQEVAARPVLALQQLGQCLVVTSQHWGVQTPLISYAQPPQLLTQDATQDDRAKAS